MTSEERQELSRLRKENRELRMEREILKKMVMRRWRTREWMKAGTVPARGASRTVVGWALSVANDRHLALRALEQALRRRCPEAGTRRWCT